MIELSFMTARFQGRAFHLCEAPNQATRLGPWCILENNGDGKAPVVIREGISGSLQNGLRVLAKEAERADKAMTHHPSSS